MHAPRVPSLAAAAVLLAACAGGGDGAPAETVTTTETRSEVVTETVTATPGASPTVPFDANTEPDSAEGEGAPVTVTGVEFATHGTYDRVVFEVGGGGLPGWNAEYVEEAIAQGSGEEVALDGSAVLELNLTNMGYPGDTGAERYDGPERIEGGPAAREIHVGGVFEGITQVFVGTDSRLPFRVFLLEDPGRVVVDVVHPSAAG